MLPLLIIIPIASGVVGVGAGFIVRQIITQKKIRRIEAKQKEIILQAKDEALKLKEEAKKEEEDKRKYLEELEKNLRRREQNLDRRGELIEGERTNLLNKEKELNGLKDQLKQIRAKQEDTLQKVAKMKKEEAKDLLLKMVEKEYKDEVVAKIKMERENVREVAEVETRKIIATVLGRLATEQVAETTISPVALPSDEMKGRIIGREGRNIQIFEKVTGVDLIIDDTPDTVVISCFDPVRRHIAKVALEKLIADGRIHPARIEELVEKVKENIGVEIKEAGEQAAYEMGVAGLPPELLKILGRLKFRTSYGQNVLQHSIESAHIAAMLAEEIGADVNLVKKAALLHDVGKAVDQDIPGAHHHISRDIAKKYGMTPNVIHAIEAHHEDIEPKTVEAIIVRVADAISGSRPGARRESLENYVKRLEELENVANSFPGVEKSYAIQAGREVRIIVRPEEIDDLSALKLAKDIAKKIEDDLQYPGTIKVNVIRETRATEFAK